MSETGAALQLRYLQVGAILIHIVWYILYLDAEQYKRREKFHHNFSTTPRCSSGHDTLTSNFSSDFRKTFTREFEVILIYEYTIIVTLKLKFGKLENPSKSRVESFWER